MHIHTHISGSPQNVFVDAMQENWKQKERERERVSEREGQFFLCADPPEQTYSHVTVL